jgi:hypothetical protein
VIILSYVIGFRAVSKATTRLTPVRFPRLKQRLKERLAVIDRIKGTIAHQIMQENPNELASFAPAHVL